MRALVEDIAYIIDIRGKESYDSAHIINAVNIPMEEIRDRLDENLKITYIQCRTGKSSYNV